jgi:hypothetical protein
VTDFRQQDQDEFGTWLAILAGQVQPTLLDAAHDFAKTVFSSVAEALQDGNVHHDLDAKLEQARLAFGERAQDLGADEPDVIAFMARVESLAETGIGASHPPEHYQADIQRALDALQAEVAKTEPTPSEAHVPVPAKRRRGRLKRTFADLAKGAGLYVERPLVNVAELTDWAQRTGLPPLDPFLHVTIVHSAIAVPWTDAKDTVVVWPRHFGRVEPLGSDQAMVIHFTSDRLTERWQEARDAGARWSFDDYRPHLTLFYGNWNHQAIDPPPFPLIFGPERSGPVDEDLNATLKVEKTDSDQRLVTGWVSIIEDEQGHPLEDIQGDIIHEADLVEAAHKFMKESREAGDNHARVKGIGTVVESTVFTRDLKEKLGLPTTFPTGWLITIKVDDDSVWRRIKQGELGAFSIGGSGIREPM